MKRLLLIAALILIVPPAVNAEWASPFNTQGKSISAVEELDVDGAVNYNISTPDLTGNSYTIASNDYTVLINDDDAQVTGTVVVGLPAAASNTGRILNIKKIGSSQTVQLDGNGAETIDGAATKDLSSQYDNYSIQCNGTAWFIL